MIKTVPLSTSLRVGRMLVTLVCALTCASACVQKSRDAAPVDREQLDKVIIKTRPTPQHPLDVAFGNKLKLLGYDTSGDEIRPGEPFVVTWYWQVIAPLEDFQLFTHVADAQGTSRLNLDGVRVLRNVYPEAQWKAGDYIRDTQDFILATDWKSNIATFYLGAWKGSDRLKITSGPNDGQNRSPALTLPVAPAARRGHDTARLIARRATGPIKLDGKFDEPDWAAAQSSGPFVQTMTGSPGAFTADARVLYDAEAVYVAFHVADDYLKSTFKEADDHLWEQDTVEIMVDPDGDEKNYFEIQVSPAGRVFDTRYETRRNPQPFGHVEWNSNTKAGVALHGTLNDEKADTGYDVEMSIPWKAFATGETPAAPPGEGASFRMNFFVLDARPSNQRAVGWSAPLIGDFHTLDRFGRVVFPSAAVPAAPAAATSITAPEKAPATKK